MDVKTQMFLVANHLEGRALDAKMIGSLVDMSPNECLALVLDIKHWADCLAGKQREKVPSVYVRMRLHEGGSMPERHGDMIDLAASEDVVMAAGDVMVIPLGASIDMEGGATGLIVPRSSTCLKHGIIMANSIGIIDNDYNGDDDVLGFVAYAIRDTTIPKGTRIAQFAAVRFPRVSVRMVGSLGNESRGGFGSTGSMVEGA